MWSRYFMHGARFPFYFQGNQALLDFQGVERQKLMLAHNDLEVLREDLRNVLSYLVVLHKPQPDIFPCCTGIGFGAAYQGLRHVLELMTFNLSMQEWLF
ncbi:uncharacterized protein LOC124653226 isoform X2 [Lolium rigidum]|uniref:uncharacterized protein LOC124653226 isoform X2 n=1 Tax=Lolium rigidum TaxID=89674 RepID=UPI001F5DC565|nr:uncharacterized protein LOC124653226 isoform X2 [Lolium rigidum]